MKMEQDGGKKIRTSKTFLGTGTNRRFGTMGRSSYLRKSAEWLGKEGKVSKKQCRHLKKGCCNNRGRVETKKWREK